VNPVGETIPSHLFHEAMGIAAPYSFQSLKLDGAHLRSEMSPIRVRKSCC